VHPVPDLEHPLVDVETGAVVRERRRLTAPSVDDEVGAESFSCINDMSSAQMTTSCSTTLSAPRTARSASRTMSFVAASLIVGGYD